MGYRLAESPSSTFVSMARDGSRVAGGRPAPSLLDIHRRQKISGPAAGLVTPRNSQAPGLDLFSKAIACRRPAGEIRRGLVTIPARVRSGRHSPLGRSEYLAQIWVRLGNTPTAGPGEYDRDGRVRQRAVAK
jgi:hypothetical protein